MLDNMYNHVMTAVSTVCLEEAKNAISALGLKLEKVVQFPVEDTAHAVIVLRKVSATPAKYPRRFAKIKQNPL